MNRCWCGNENLKDYSEEYYRCDKCHTLISKSEIKNDIYDIKDENTDLYGGNYWKVTMAKLAGKDTISEVIDMYLSERAVYWIKYVLKYVKLGAKIAEVGCGLGQLQYIVKHLGFEQVGYELSPEICDFLRNNLQLKMHCGSFEQSDCLYDSIFALDLFEHLDAPGEFLKNCSKSLNAEGILMLQMPCYDYSLSFEKMQQEKPRFQELLQKEQHIYLYSKEAIQDILKRYGFENIIFEPAFFGDDYDMFLFASKRPIKENTFEEIDTYLNSVENGRLVKAMITLFDENRKLEKLYEEADRDRQERLENITVLTKKLQESEADRTVRLEQINQLTAILQESEADRAARLEQINQLTELLQESEADRAARLEQINQLTEILQKSKQSCVSDGEQSEA